MNARSRSIARFIGFFLLITFIVTCNMVLFLQFLSFDEAQIRQAAPLTMGNVIFLTIILCGIDRLRYSLLITRPVKRISDAIAQVMRGDFSVRIEKPRGIGFSGEYDVIIDDLNRLFAELGSVETLQTDFISSVSHELKTPMAAIQNYGTLLQGRNLSEEKRLEYAKKITEQTKKLSGMVSNILKLNKLENQQIFPAIEQLDLSELVCESMLEFETIWEEKGLQIETSFEDGVTVRGDREMLSLIWTNLMSNAVKFTEQGGTIRIAVSKERGCGIVRISDTGCGMDAETGSHIFQKFYQGDTSHAGSGNGLGLALVKRIVDIHKGDISVFSTPGEGSTFTVSLTAVQS